jgi:hypothetical protein
MASMWTLIIKNAGVAQMIEDLGISIPAASQITLSDQFEYEEIASSDDLRNLVNNATLVVNDGTSDLSSANGVLYLTLYNAKETEDKFYTKTALQTSTGAAVHWDNITNAPAFGSTFWLSPVKAMVSIISDTAPSTPATGDFFIDTTDDHLYKYDGATWVDTGAPTTGLRVINLADSAELIYEWSGSAWEAQAVPVDNNALLVDDAGDSKQAQFVYEDSTTNWIKMADIDYGEPNDLDGAYDQGGAGAGRIITVDTGAVKLDATSSTYAPIELTQQTALPTTGLAAGQLAVKDGILCCYDGTRSKWLSVQRVFLAFGRKGLTSNQYLSFAAGSLPSNNSGYRIPRNATVVSISGQLDASGTAAMRLRSNDNLSNIASLSITAALGNQDNTLNVDISATDFLQMYSDNATAVSDPIVIVEIAYRP